MIGKFNDLKEWLIAITTLFLCILAVLSLGLFVTIITSHYLLTVPQHWHGLSRRDVLSDYQQLCWYLQGVGSLHWRYIPFSQRGMRHFHDVKRLIQPVVSLCPFFFISACLSLWYEKRSYQLWRLITPWRAIMVMYVVCVAMVLVSFQDSFLWFHYIMFSNLDWVFNAKQDPIILLLTPRFFASCFAIWCFTSLIVMLVFFILMNIWANESVN